MMTWTNLRRPIFDPMVVSKLYLWFPPHIVSKLNVNSYPTISQLNVNFTTMSSKPTTQLNHVSPSTVNILLNEDGSRDSNFLTG